MPSLQKAFIQCLCLRKLSMTVCHGLLSWPPLSWPCWLGFLVSEHADTSWLPPAPQSWLLNTPVWPWTHCPSARTKSEKDRTANRDRVTRQVTFRCREPQETQSPGSIWYLSSWPLNPPNNWQKKLKQVLEMRKQRHTRSIQSLFDAWQLCLL